MKWHIQYRIKGNTRIFSKAVNLNHLFTKRNQVKDWFLSTHTTKHVGLPYLGLYGDRKDIEFINCKAVI